MCRNLLKKFIAQDDDVFIRLAKQSVLVSVVVPNPSFAEKIGTRPMHNFGIRGQTVRPKEDRGAKCAFKRSNQSAILLATFAHAERFQHFGSALELDRRTLLLDGQRRQEDWTNSVLPERDPIIRTAGDLKNELAVSPLIEELIGRQTADGQAA